MKTQATSQELATIRNDYLENVCDGISSLEELVEYGFTEGQAEDTLGLWDDIKSIIAGAQSGSDLNLELYGKIEAMARANPILQTLKAISLKLERLTNQADRIDALLIPFAGPYPDLPTLLFLENLCSAIDDLPLPFVNHFSIELDMLRVHSKTTQVWLEALEDKHTAQEKEFAWICKKCGKVHDDIDQCECGEMSTWRKLAIESDRKAQETAGDKIYWTCRQCGKINSDTDVCKCGGRAPWISLVTANSDDDEQPF